MAFRDVIGQERALLILQRALLDARLAHTYLFYGLPGVGKKLTALQFAKTLYCLSNNTDACGTCVSCHKIATGNHPDVVFITPDNMTIKIEQVRTIQRRLGYKPYEGQRTTIIIDECELLTPPAANALLKTLEEPPGSALLLLLAGKKEALPVTIVSRCQLVPFQPLTPAHIHTILERQGADRETAALTATFAGGRLDRLHQGDLTQELATRQNAYSILQDVSQARDIALFLQSRKLAGKREQCEELLHWLSLLCRDLTMLKVASAPFLYNPDFCRELTSTINHASLESLLEAFELIQQLQASLSMNANPQLIFEQLLVQFQQIFALSG